MDTKERTEEVVAKIKETLEIIYTLSMETNYEYFYDYKSEQYARHIYEIWQDFLDDF